KTGSRIPSSYSILLENTHQLCRIAKLSKMLLFETRVDTASFCQDAFFIMWFLYFYKCEWHSVDEQGEVWSKFFISILVDQFSGDVKIIVIEIFKINHLNVGSSR